MGNTQKPSPQKSLMLYGIELFGWGILVVHLFRSIAFKSIPGMSLTQSNWLFWGLWFFCLVMGFVMTPRQCRSDTTVFATINSPVALYLIWAYFRVYPTAFKVALAIIGVALVLFLGLIVATNIKDVWMGKYHGKYGRFLVSVAHKCRMIIGVGLSVVFLVFYLNLFCGLPIMKPRTEALNPQINAQKISSNIDTVLLLQEEEWSKLSVQKRLEVLQTVANIEATYLGLPHELNLTINPMDDVTDGQYDDSTHTISINPDHIADDSAHDLVETVAHEAYHAYEHRLVDLYSSTGPVERNLLIFDRIAEYEDNFANYIKGSDDIEGYITQPVEADSVRYAMVATIDYYDAIEEYLNPTE